MKVRVKYRLETIEVEFDGSGSDLRRAVEEATSVPPARQKLVAKGKLVDSTTDLSTLKQGTVVMLLEQSANGTYGSRVAPGTSQSRGQAFQTALLKTKAAIKKAVTPGPSLKAKEIEERVAAAAKLNYMALNGVRIESIPSGSFERNLTRIELVNCTFPADCALFTSSALAASLKKLVLNGCQLKDDDMVIQSIRGLKNLVHLELKGNKLTSLPKLDHPMKLLDVSNNTLTGIQGCPLTVEEIHLRHCSISTLDLGVLVECRVVVARSNDIREIVAVPSSTLEVLDIRDNRNLSKLPDNFFRDLHRLVQVEMANTGIQLKDLEDMAGYARYAERQSQRQAKRFSLVREYELQ